ncbi:hypothetical protein ACFFTM_19305 [Pseudoduganella plicata]|uniref:Transmembrane protein n=1 Tax=Pseudoduganella plicata TaxID=321984 RepID=A0A4P7BFM3_9BURK|nr:hypothetical protein [Pseudoduganella plicata]QBQ37030.1 hypothetical protein E1742_13255 [Pseudoduganella plicata]GGY99922.1 hypothetical protein GCM10007388_37040 [Pseudoduganella plicata]
MAVSTAAPDGAHAAQLDDLHDLHHHEGDGGAHVHILTALQEEAFCWTAGCFVVAAIVFAIWTLRTAPPLQGKARRKTQRKTRRKKCRPGRSAGGQRGVRR